WLPWKGKWGGKERRVVAPKGTTSYVASGRDDKGNVRTFLSSWMFPLLPPSEPLKSTAEASARPSERRARPSPAKHDPATVPHSSSPTCSIITCSTGSSVGGYAARSEHSSPARIGKAAADSRLQMR